MKINVGHAEDEGRCMECNGHTDVLVVRFTNGTSARVCHGCGESLRDGLRLLSAICRREVRAM